MIAALTVAGLLLAYCIVATVVALIYRAPLVAVGDVFVGLFPGYVVAYLLGRLPRRYTRPMLIVLMLALVIAGSVAKSI